MAVEVEKGKELFTLEKYTEALNVFLSVLKQDERHREAKTYLDRTRQILQPMVDNYFRTGLQHYTKENYKAALEEWEKGLLINPDHQGTLEYKKRAEEKLKALERLK
jgi:tetratricopeptide (TPR) repeat protein